MESQRTILKTNTTSTDTRYYISSLEEYERTPEQFAKIITGHWASVENRNHWTRDHCFGEDRCRTRNPNIAANLAVLRNALLTIALNQSGSTTELIETCAHDPNYALCLISNPL